MVWARVRIGGRDVPRAALMVEVSGNGLPSPALMQFDTGAINWVYRKPGDSPHERFWRGNSSVTLDGTVAGRPFHDHATSRSGAPYRFLTAPLPQQQSVRDLHPERQRREGDVLRHRLE